MVSGDGPQAGSYLGVFWAHRGVWVVVLQILGDGVGVMQYECPQLNCRYGPSRNNRAIGIGFICATGWRYLQMVDGLESKNDPDFGAVSAHWNSVECQSHIREFPYESTMPR